MIDTDHDMERRAVDALTQRVRTLTNTNTALERANESLMKRWNDAKTAAATWAIQADEADARVKELEKQVKELTEYVQNNRFSAVAV